MSGRSPSGPGSRASHEAAKASSPEASIPNADDLRLLSAGPDPRGGFSFSFADFNENGVIRILAEHLYEMMGCGTPHELNCVQMEVKPRDFAQAFTLTLQREGGKSPLRLKAEAKTILVDALAAIESGRREPLEIARDRIKNWLEADPASAIEARSDATPKSDAAEGESAVAKPDARNQSNPMTQQDKRS